MIRIIIADDHKVLLDGFNMIFKDQAHIHVVATACHGLEVLDLLTVHEDIDIVMLDINMPQLNGIETCRKIAKQYPEVKVVTISMYKQASYVKRMKSYGAKAYLLKDDTAEEMITAIETVHAGKEYYSNQLLGLLMNQVLYEPKDVLPTVSDREKEVLVLISEGYSNKAISAQLFLSVHTVDSHRKNLISKFNVKNTAELVKKTMDLGIL